MRKQQHDHRSPMVFKGRTLQKALAKAEAHFQCSMDQLSYRILQEGTSRGLGLLGSPCIVEVEPAKVQADEKTHNYDVESGKIGVVDGKTKYYAPKEQQAKFPTMTPCKGVNIRVDGTIIEKQTVIFPEAEVELQPDFEEPSISIFVDVTDDAMEASLHVNRTAGVQYRLVDQSPESDLILQVASEELEPPPLTEEQVQEASQKAGVSYGIDAGAVAHALTPEAEFPLIVARGEPPVPPQDDHIEWFYSFGVSDEWIKEDDPYTNSLVTVERGNVVATFHQGREGRPGKTVRGESVAPQESRRVPFEPGDGVAIRKNQAVAVKPGRPIYRNGRIDILPVKVLEDVRGVDGAVEFEGDVVVKGQVLEAGVIVAQGNIVVQGMVSGAHLIADGNIVLHKGVVKSEVHAGGPAAVYVRVLPRVSTILNATSLILKKAMPQSGDVIRAISGREALEVLSGPTLKRMVRVCREVKEEPETPRETHILKRLTALCDELIKVVETANDKGMIETDAILRLYQDLGKMHKEYSSVKLQPAGIVTPYATNARLNASGDIAITESGCYHTTLNAGKDVRLIGKKASLRGSHARSGGVVETDEIGSHVGAPTSVEVPSDGVIRARLVHPGTKIGVGDQRVILDKLGRVIEARLNDEGELVM